VFLSGKLLAYQLYGVGGFDPLVLILAIATLALCALAATFCPRAAPAIIESDTALRAE